MFSKIFLLTLTIVYVLSKDSAILAATLTEDNKRQTEIITCNSSTDLIAAARDQIGKTLYYDPSYKKLNYPMGDIALEKGVCSDVIIRALRHFGVDLQEEVAKSIQRNYASYKHYLTQGKADKNIDHRRVKVLSIYFKLAGHATPNTPQAGDIVIFDLGKGIWHIGIISDTLSADKKRPLVIHNICCGAKEEDMIEQFPILYTFRLYPNFFKNKS